jgi:hypothetical protein
MKRWGKPIPIGERRSTALPSIETLHTPRLYIVQLLILLILLHKFVCNFGQILYHISKMDSTSNI